MAKWNSASEDWHTPIAENDLRAGGKFFSRMEAKDGSFGFDFGGIYDEVKLHEVIAYTMGDGRKVKITFKGVKAYLINRLCKSENTIYLPKKALI